MKFKVRALNIHGGGHFVAVINEVTASLEGVHVSGRVKLSNHGSKQVIAVVDLSDEGVLGRYEIGLFNEVIEELRVKDGDEIEVIPVSQPKSVDFIKKKLDGIELSEREIIEIVNDIVSNRLSQVEMSAFVTACYTRDLTMDETFFLTKGVIRSGSSLDFGKGVIADKHCIGGISGNRTTMILVPIIACLGLKIPKTSSRSITSPAGTADTMEVLAPVELSLSKIKSVVSKAGGCIVWGGAMNLAAADDKLISVRHPLALDPLGLMLASIMAKKKASGSNHVIIDIPLGVAAKTKNIGEAKFMQRSFEELGRRLGMNVRVLITDGNNPVGKGVGPVLEARDVLWVLSRDPRGPVDLRDKSLYLAGELLELCGRARPGEGLFMARRALEDGSALKKFKEIIRLQGGKYVEPDDLIPGKYSFDVVALKGGVLKFVDDDLVSRIARLAGAPLDKGAGVYIHKCLEDYVTKGSVVLTVYSESKRLLSEALKAVTKKLFIIE